ncbi:DedA family protein [Salidesulfovibrio onnuriiensis]|uniref:DedA family protein n=1 Tax=Salidesulfovibrio onnuriiensis TaxID=2583823 RepID=UPI0011CC5E09|nr:DedA family protein [Salidesulfovibrio onnuriiensis]
MTSLADIVSTYGYLAVVIGTMLEGEIVLVVAGFLAHQGYLNIDGVMLCAFFGSLTGDQCFFLLGRGKGAEFLSRRPHWQARTQRIRTMLHEHKRKVMLGFRFMYGLRSVVPLVLGASGFPLRMFIAYNAIGAALWAVVVGYGGYFFGYALEAFFDDISKYEHWVIGALVVGGMGLWLYHRFREKKRNRTA